jgi:branched-chain amino acid transport system ATP-binding protein
MLHIDALHAGYGRGTVLHDIDLHVRPGTVHAIVGYNGAGKTTLLHTIAGLHPPRRGRIRLAGQDVTSWPAHQRVRAGIALVPQGRRVWASLTVAEHLRLATRPARHRGGLAWTRVRVLELLPQLAARESHRGGQLSGGEQQMLAIARALLTQPRLLLLDEPTEGLAPSLAVKIQHLVGQLTGTGPGGLTVLLAAPHPDLAAAVAGQVTVLTAGAATTLPGLPDPAQLRTALTTPTLSSTVEKRNP